MFVYFTCWKLLGGILEIIDLETFLQCCYSYFLFEMFWVWFLGWRPGVLSLQSSLQTNTLLLLWNSSWYFSSMLYLWEHILPLNKTSSDPQGFQYKEVLQYIWKGVCFDHHITLKAYIAHLLTRPVTFEKCIFIHDAHLYINTQLFIVSVRRTSYLTSVVTVWYQS